MHIQLTTNEIARHLHNDAYSSFSRKGAYALAEYLEDWERDIDEQRELDVIEIRCSYSEYESLLEFCSDYFGSMGGKGADERVPEFDDSDDLEKWVKNYIEENGVLIEFDGGIIVSEF